ncbi:GntR family transcriptional regulator [Kitasatospora sp. NPDC048296]|uniref:GntR family transcriptional regulator n=1 Tax=Kitasatospora sp. NPDC048296 TaxID=3364048 RepID=UPI0037174BE9
MAPTKRSRDLADQIRRDIDNRVYEVGDRLPNDQELATQGWSSSGTVRDAYRILKSQGYVVARQGQGRFVRDRRVVTIPLSRYSQTSGVEGLGPWEAATRAQGLNGQMVFVAVSTMEAPASIAEKLALTAADQYKVTQRTRHAVLDGEVLQVQQAWYPAEVARRCGLDREEKVAGGTLLALGAQYQIGHGDERVGFRLATDAEVATLKVPVGGWVARAERLLVDESGLPLELLQISAVPDRTDWVYDGLDYRRML